MFRTYTLLLKIFTLNLDTNSNPLIKALMLHGLCQDPITIIIVSSANYKMLCLTNAPQVMPRPNYNNNSVIGKLQNVMLNSIVDFETSKLS